MKNIKKLREEMLLHMIVGVLYFSFLVSTLINSYLLFTITFFTIPVLWILKGFNLTFEYFKKKKKNEME